MDFDVKENQEDFFNELNDFYEKRMLAEFNRGADWWTSTAGLFTINYMAVGLWLYGLYMDNGFKPYLVVTGVLLVFISGYLSRMKNREDFEKRKVGIFRLYEERSEVKKRFFVEEFLTAGGRNYLNTDDLNSIYNLLKRKLSISNGIVKLLFIPLLLGKFGEIFFSEEFVNEVQFNVFNTGFTYNDLLIYPFAIAVTVLLISAPFRKEDGYSFLKDLIKDIRKDLKREKQD